LGYSNACAAFSDNVSFMFDPPALIDHIIRTLVRNFDPNQDGIRPSTGTLCRARRCRKIACDCMDIEWFNLIGMS